MIRRDDAGEREISFYVEIDLSTADPFGLRVGRFYDRHPLGLVLSGRDENVWDSDADIYSETRAALTVAKWTHGAHVIGMVPNFDTEVLANLLRAEHLTPAWHYHLQDVEGLAVGFLRGLASDELSDASFREKVRAVTALPWESDDISRACGVEPPGDDERHTALGDARWAMRLFDRITGGADS